MVKERQSNIELLRVVCMFFIVLEHILLIGTDFFSAPVGNQLIVANTIIGFTYVGVNCFILITGYFGADFSWKRLLSLYLICAFYELFGFVYVCCHGTTELSPTALSYILFPISHHASWFIRSYVILLLLLPLLNAGVEKIDKKKHLYVLLLLSILNIYFGWFQKQDNFNANGYNASQMIYLYVIGRYFGKYVNWEKIRQSRNYILAGWLLLSIMWGVIQNINDLVHVVPHWNGWAYNNPIVMLASMMLFAYFCCINIPQSKIINMFGASMLGVFLLHMNRYLVNPNDYPYGFVHNVLYSTIISQSLLLQITLLVALASALVVLFAVVDIPRERVHKRLLNKLLSLSFHTHTHTHTHTHKARISLDYEQYKLCLMYT